MSAESLFTPVTLGAIPLRNRIVMAPMTRARAGI
jgi:2,4-dienoyl-CoA reductase-like NADH-dependent reductase (Old Yellow Enzyme family)